jgi:hypothetical protein
LGDANLAAIRGRWAGPSERRQGTEIVWHPALASDLFFFLNFPIGSGQLNRLDLIRSDGKQLTEIGSDRATAELLYRHAVV